MQEKQEIGTIQQRPTEVFVLLRSKQTFFMHEIFEHDLRICPLVNDFQRLVTHYIESLKESAFAVCAEDTIKSSLISLVPYAILFFIESLNKIGS